MSIFLKRGGNTQNEGRVLGRRVGQAAERRLPFGSTFSCILVQFFGMVKFPKSNLLKNHSVLVVAHKKRYQKSQRLVLRKPGRGIPSTPAARNSPHTARSQDDGVERRALQPRPSRRGQVPGRTPAALWRTCPGGRTQRRRTCRARGRVRRGGRALLARRHRRTQGTHGRQDAGRAGAPATDVAASATAQRCTPAAERRRAGSVDAQRCRRVRRTRRVSHAAAGHRTAQRRRGAGAGGRGRDGAREGRSPSAECEKRQMRPAACRAASPVRVLGHSRGRQPAHSQAPHDGLLTGVRLPCPVPPLSVFAAQVFGQCPPQDADRRWCYPPCACRCRCPRGQRHQQAVGPLWQGKDRRPALPDGMVCTVRWIEACGRRCPEETGTTRDCWSAKLTCAQRGSSGQDGRVLV